MLTLASFFAPITTYSKVFGERSFSVLATGQAALTAALQLAMIGISVPSLRNIELISRRKRQVLIPQVESETIRQDAVPPAELMSPGAS
jgi:hypothetical protein